MEAALKNNLAGHYMWDIAKVHLELLTKKDSQQPAQR